MYYCVKLQNLQIGAYFIFISRYKNVNQNLQYLLQHSTNFFK